MDQRAEYSEAKLIKLASAGDADAFASLVERHQLYVYNLALRTLGNSDDAADAAQEAFVRAWLALPNFREQASLRTWLYRITLNLCFNRVPRLRRQIGELTNDESDDLAEPYSPELDPAASLETRERRAQVHKAIDALPEQYRVLVFLRYQDELAYEDIAGLLNIPVSAVKTGLFRAKGRLRQALNVYEEQLI